MSDEERHDDGVILVVKKETDIGDQFLVLKRQENWQGWEIPKGHLEEDDHDYTAELELEEEAGIDPEQIVHIKNTGDTIEWDYYWQEDGKDVHVFCEYEVYVVEVEPNAEVDTSANPDQEHEYGEFVTIHEAIEVLEHEEQADLLHRHGL